MIHRLRLTLTMVSIMLASPLLARASDCVTGTLQDYINLGSSGCAVGDYLFYDFGSANIFPPPGEPFSSDSITIAPVTDDGLRFSFDSTSFTTTPAWNGLVGTGVDYHVVRLSGQPIFGASLSIDANYNNGSAAAFEANGSSVIFALVCLPSFPCSPIQPSDSDEFVGTAVSSANQFFVSGDAIINSVTEEYSDVPFAPEPSSFVVVSICAMGLFAIRNSKA